MLRYLRLLFLAPIATLGAGCYVHSRPETPHEIREEHREERHEEKREEKREKHGEHEHG